jgi:hypothetical protein
MQTCFASHDATSGFLPNTLSWVDVNTDRQRIQKISAETVFPLICLEKPLQSQDGKQ